MIRRPKIMAGLLGLLLAATGPASADVMVVQNKTDEIHEQAMTFSEVLATVKRGDTLTVVQKQGKWYKVTTANGKITGWIHEGGVKQGLAAADADAGTGVSHDEASLTQKGFTQQVEDDFKAKHKDLDFKWIDKMETWKTSTKDVLAFLKDGNVVMPEGGAK